MSNVEGATHPCGVRWNLSNNPPSETLVGRCKEQGMLSKCGKRLRLAPEGFCRRAAESEYLSKNQVSLKFNYVEGLFRKK